MNKDKLHKKLESEITPYKLLESKFYKAWSEGCLPIEALKAYASEYGQFICLLPNGWESQDDLETAQEEREHIELWGDFAKALGTGVGESHTEPVDELLKTSKELFDCASTAMGALYAFESQQPETSVSKLMGLRSHYSLSPSLAEPYFEVHSKNQHEADKLLVRMEKLTPKEQEIAIEACRGMSKVLRDALDGLYHKYCC